MSLCLCGYIKPTLLGTPRYGIGSLRVILLLSFDTPSTLLRRSFDALPPDIFISTPQIWGGLPQDMARSSYTRPIVILYSSYIHPSTLSRPIFSYPPPRYGGSLILSTGMDVGKAKVSYGRGLESRHDGLPLYFRNVPILTRNEQRTSKIKLWESHHSDSPIVSRREENAN